MLKRITGTRKEAKEIDVRRKVRKRIGKTQTLRCVFMCV
jgi:hypothetical protein